MLIAATRPAIGELGRHPLRVLREHVWFIGIVFAYLLAGLILAWSEGVLEWMSLSLYTDRLFERYAILLGAFAIGYPIYVMAVIRPERLTRYMVDDLRRRIFTVDRLFAGLIVLGLLPLFVSVFTSIKIMIPQVNPFDWDPTFAEWDRLLHGGVHPWELLQPLLGHPIVTNFLNIIYHLWFFVLYGVVCWQAFARRDPRLRMQFFLSMLLAWSLLGSLAATIFASVGPCYYGYWIEGPDPYAPLMAYLRAADEIYPVWALTVQDVLWQGYLSGRLEEGVGVSAMPSMHIAAVMLNVLFGWRVNRALGWAFTVFALLTFLGSVHLGWHYAIDGYAAVLGTLAIWWGVGRLLARDPFFGPVMDRAATTAAAGAAASSR